jgi:hypothetical protein
MSDGKTLDEAVLAEMRALRFDVVGLLQEMRSVAINQRTAVYKMLKRRRTVEEIVEAAARLKARRKSEGASDGPPEPLRSTTWLRSSQPALRTQLDRSPLGHAKTRLRVRTRAEVVKPRIAKQ